MKVKELIEQLQKLDPEMYVYIQEGENLWRETIPLKMIDSEITCTLIGNLDDEED
jgi:hypothetical protein